MDLKPFRTGAWGFFTATGGAPTRNGRGLVYGVLFASHGRAAVRRWCMGSCRCLGARVVRDVQPQTQAGVTDAGEDCRSPTDIPGAATADERSSSRSGRRDNWGLPGRLALVHGVVV
jgi:hypothetical protein